MDHCTGIRGDCRGTWHPQKSEHEPGRPAARRTGGGDPHLGASEVPPGFWQTGGIPAALRARHMGHVIRAYRKHPYHGGRLPQEVVGAWVGITQAQLSRIENGPPIVHLDRLIQWARLLRIPQEYLWFKLPESVDQTHPEPAVQLDRLDQHPGPEGSMSLVHSALLRASPACGVELSDEPSLSSFEHRVLGAWTARVRIVDDAPLLVLVGGFAGSGKTEFGRFLSSVTGWAHLDKDTLTRPLVESLLTSLDADPNDRQTSLYVEQVRPVEYRCLLTAAFDNLGSGVSTVLTAPFLGELPNPSWLRCVTRRCTTLRVDVVMIWVDADVETMYAYLQARDAARDTWKLNHWDDYLGSIDLALRPHCPHFLVDNSQNAAVGLAEQAQRLAGLVHR